MVTESKRSGEFEAFSPQKGELSNELGERLNYVQREILGLPEATAMGPEGERRMEELVSRYIIQPPEFNYDGVTYGRETVKVQRRGMEWLRGSIAPENFEAEVSAYAFYVPYDGDATFLKYAPSPRLVWTLPVVLEDGQLSFRVVADGKTAEQVNQERDVELDRLRQQVGHLTAQLNQYNQELPRVAKEALEKRQIEAQRNRDMDGGINVPPRS